MGQWIELTASDGIRLAAYRADPAGPDKPRGGLVVVQEIFGVNSHIRAVCDGFAADGYVTIAPALFDRYERSVDIGYTPDDIARGRELKARASTDAAVRDVEAARDAAASAGRVGIVGYCWGGFIVWMSAARLPGFACAIAYYGGGILDHGDEQPKCPLMAHFGERDTVIPVAGVEKLAAAHPEAQVFVYAADHGFNCDQRKSYDAAAATLARERTLEFLRQNVG
ncbi:MAG TPA: dienelactone hydrolase family protein [Casimicrobiaceae bacterium]